MECRTDVLKTKRSLVIAQPLQNQMPQNLSLTNRLAVLQTNTARGDDFWDVLETFSRSRYR